VVDLILLMRS